MAPHGVRVSPPASPPGMPIALRTMRVLGETDTPLSPDGDPDEHSPVNEERSTLLDSEHIHSSPSEEEDDEDHTRQVSSWKKLPWWKRPSPYWLIFGAPMGSIAYSALLAPKVALYTTLVCRVHRPEYITNYLNPLDSTFPLTNSLMVTNDNATQAAVNSVSVLLPDATSTVSIIDYIQNNPAIEQKCASDPLVQATVASLTAVFTTTMGVLCCLTTGWWSSLSDRRGRRNVIFASMAGVFMTEVVHLITVWFVDVLPGGYWFPVVGFIIEGLCGGTPTGAAVTHTYIADTTDPSTRSRYFSLLLGFAFTGVAVGPLLGGLLIRMTGTIMSAFYLALALHGIYLSFMFFILPESLTRARARDARLRRKQEMANNVSSNRFLGILKSCTQFFSPLVVLLPKKSSNTNPLKRSNRDWSLFYIVLVYGIAMSDIGSGSYKFQYVASQFHWTPEITSYFLSSVGVGRALFLTIILPLVIKYLKSDPVQPPSVSNDVEFDDLGKPIKMPTSRSVVFDLKLARTSLAVDVVAGFVVAVTSTGTIYTLMGVVSALGAGFFPALQALAIDRYTNLRPGNRSEMGKLFGALSVTQVLASQIISPAAYGFIYSSTVATFPRAILFVSFSGILLALACLSFVRIPTGTSGDRIVPGNGNDHMVTHEGLDA